MSVTVSPQLAALLEQRQLTVAELERLIKAHFGLAVNAKSLYRLTQSAPMQQADLEVAGATAAVLGVGLDDLFRVETSPDDADDQAPLLGPAESQRFTELLERRNNGALGGAEWDELEGLLASYGHALHERRMKFLARQLGVSGEQAKRESAAELDQALAWWEVLAADPERARLLAEQATALRAQWPV